MYEVLSSVVKLRRYGLVLKKHRFLSKSLLYQVLAMYLPYRAGVDKCYMALSSIQSTCFTHHSGIGNFNCQGDHSYIFRMLLAQWTIQGNKSNQQHCRLPALCTYAVSYNLLVSLESYS